MDIEIKMLIDNKKEILKAMANCNWTMQFIEDDEKKLTVENYKYKLDYMIKNIDIRLNILYWFK